MPEEKPKWEQPEWEGWKIISEMLDNPDENGIYPTSIAYEKLYDFVVAQKQSEREKGRAEALRDIAELSNQIFVPRTEPFTAFKQISDFMYVLAIMFEKELNSLTQSERKERE